MAKQMKKIRKDSQIAVRICSSERNVLERVAAAKHMTVSELLRDLGRREIERLQVQPDQAA